MIPVRVGYFQLAKWVKWGGWRWHNRPNNVKWLAEAI